MWLNDIITTQAPSLPSSHGIRVMRSHSTNFVLPTLRQLLFDIRRWRVILQWVQVMSGVWKGTWASTTRGTLPMTRTLSSMPAKTKPSIQQ